ncbi:hypothetical protein Tco_1332635 [Tanacetum coccineum]
MLNLHRRGIHEQFTQILKTIGKSQTPTPKPDAPNFAIITKSGTSTRDPPYPTAPRPTTVDPIKGTTERGILEDHEPTVVRNEEIPQSPTYYHPSKLSSVPFPSWLKKQKNDDDDERLLSIFKQIHINLPFLEAMVHMPKGAKVLKDLLSHKEKLKKAASSIKLSEECRLRSLEMDEDNLVLIILGRPFLATARVVIYVHEGKLSLRVGSETVTFNIGKYMRSKYSHDDYLYCADHTTKLVREQWVDTVDHNGRWIETEEEQDPKEVRAVSFYPKPEPIEPLEWKAPENQLKPSMIEPPKLELKELPEHLEYAFLQGNDQLPVVISSTFSPSEKAKLLKVLRNHKGSIAWSIAYIKEIDLSFCTHKILMEDEFKPTVQPQRRVNPNIQEVVKKEVVKLLGARLILLAVIFSKVMVINQSRALYRKT